MNEGLTTDTPQQGSTPTPMPKTRRRLFSKYVALFVAVVCIALLSNGAFDVYFYYNEHKASLIRIQREQAEAAAAKIGQFIKEIESQLGWTTQLPWSAGSIDQRRFDALRLLRQVPAITELAQIDASGKERLRVSRLAMDVVGSGADLSSEPTPRVGSSPIPISAWCCAIPTCRAWRRCARRAAARPGMLRSR
jgi:two-component system, NtrC family, sensor kinase